MNSTVTKIDDHKPKTNAGWTGQLKGGGDEFDAAIERETEISLRMNEHSSAPDAELQQQIQAHHSALELIDQKIARQNAAKEVDIEQIEADWERDRLTFDERMARLCEMMKAAQEQRDKADKTCGDRIAQVSQHHADAVTSLKAQKSAHEAFLAACAKALK